MTLSYAKTRHNVGLGFFVFILFNLFICSLGEVTLSAHVEFGWNYFSVVFGFSDVTNNCKQTESFNKNPSN